MLSDVLNCVPIPLARQDAASSIDLTNFAERNRGQGTELYNMEFEKLIRVASDAQLSDETRVSHTNELKRRIEHLSNTRLSKNESVKTLLNLYSDGQISLLSCCKRLMEKCK